MSTASSSYLKPIGIGYAVAVGALVAYNFRWRYISTLWRKEGRVLPVVRVDADDSKMKTTASKKKRRPIVVLLHGMWHDASWYADLQLALKEHGYSSMAIDLLPGERFLLGFTQKEIVADLHKTLREQLQEDDAIVLLGHSQGGLVAQSCLQNSAYIENKTVATVLMGTYPLGLMMPIQKIMQLPSNMYNNRGVWGIYLLGRILSVSYLKHIFLLPTTDETKLKDYCDKILNAPSDGLITMSHFPDKTVGVISNKPALILEAQNDIIYPPALLAEAFDERFPQATHVTIPNQAHCFMDPPEDSQPTMPEALVAWLDKLYSGE